ncbi:MAG TPA: thiamine phosphate synthase [Thermoanaerobaculia bacterium]|nr:thiamine phosphate synthase [Thermoanaerobaculia bacterium]
MTGRSLPPVYAITDRRASDVSAAENVAIFLEAGIRCVQIREKDLPGASLLAETSAAAPGARRAGARLLVDDRADVARIVACGVHLGEEDLPAADARSLLGPEALIGVSTHDPESARKAFSDPAADYVAFGPIFATPVKSGRIPVGLEALSRVAAMRTKPVVAIGGIPLDRLDAVWDAGADSAAMIGAINGPDAPELARRAVGIARRRFLPRKIWLVGFMGSGKTTIGRILARRLALPFFDLDAEIEAASSKPVRAIFETEGEAEFRRRERAYVDGSLAIPAGVFAAGGGTFAVEANRRAILREGVSIFLDVPFDVLAARVPARADRPLFEDVAQARGLLEERLPFYRMAGLSVPLTGGETPEDSAEELLRRLEERTCVI